MSRLVAWLLGAALCTWSIALLRELWGLLDHNECDRSLRRAGLPSWLRARQWRAIHGLLVASLASLLPWAAARRSWPAALGLMMALGAAWCLPHVWLHWRIQRRLTAMRRELPGALARLCWATHCLAPFEEALQLTLRWGPGGPLGQVLQEQLLQPSLRAARWPRPRVAHPLTPVLAELLSAAHEAGAGRIDHDEQLRLWQWLLVRSHPAARPAYDLRRRQAGAPADGDRDLQNTA